VRVIFIYIWLVICAPLTAQLDTLAEVQLENLENETYQELVKEVRYKTTKSKLLPRKFEAKKKERKQEKRETDNLNVFNGPIAKMLVYGVIAIFVLIILWLLLSNINLDKKDSELTEVISEVDEIEDIEEVDADSGYHDAIKAGNYRLACRMSFIKVLQKLEQNEKIRWKKEKTNRHYLKEMTGDDMADTFRSLVQTYELVWYGNRYIDEAMLSEYTAIASKIVTINQPTHD